MKRIVGTFITAALMVGGMVTPASAGGVQGEVYVAGRCVTAAQSNQFPFDELKNQEQAEGWLGHPRRRGNPAGADNEWYSVQYKMCGRRWKKGGLYLYYLRTNRRLVFGVELGPVGGTLDTFPHVVAGPSMPIAIRSGK